MLFVLPALAQTVHFEKSKWTELQFSQIPPNKVEFNTSSIGVSVEASASPLIYRLDRVTEITGFAVSLVLTGELPKQSGFEEDSFFRLGFVVIGENRLGTMGKLFAPKWVRQLFDLAPPDTGLDKIYFYNVVTAPDQLGTERIHPKSKYMYEKPIAVKIPGSNEFKYTFEKSLKTAALWISIDGDDTKSKFTTTIKNITLNPL